MFVLIWWILIISCVVEFKIIYGNEKVIITVPVHIKKIHHTKMIYKIIEKPVHADTVSTPSAGQINYQEEHTTPHVPHGAHGNGNIGNQTVATASRYRERGQEWAPVDQRVRGYGEDRGHLRDGDPSKGTTTHGVRIEGARHKYYGDSADRGPHRHVNSYKYGSHANGAALQQLQHQVHGPRHFMSGHHVNDVWFGKQAGKGVKHIGDGHKHGHSVDVMHGHFGDVLRVAGDHDHGGVHFSEHKPMHLGDHRGVLFGDHQHVYFSDHKHGNVRDPKKIGHLGHHNFEHIGVHGFEHFGGVGHGNFGGAWRTQDTSGPGVRAQNQRGRPTEPLGANQHIDNLHRNVVNFGNTVIGQYGHSAANADSPGPNAAYRELDERGFPRLLHDHKFSNPVYGHHSTGGYQVQENVADFDGMIPTAVPQPHPATTAQVFQVDHNYPSVASGIGGGDTLDGMSSVSAIASPPTVNSVYYTLDPVVPYNDVTLQPQRETVRRWSAENQIVSKWL
ncbi:uncharacterized protein LOC111033372 [Myzus persicae]|uniref:uncharacterized protein LOC111033372 n=1 Tax=Myzus persicae TaxID=13164 RepID=UPI000B936EDF|nr:uncharacterized protein LOC111033372 [Myzus persicae]